MLTPDSEAGIRADLEPLCAPEPGNYHKGLYGNRIINQLANVMIAAIERLQDAEHTGLAQTLAEQAHVILLDYDEDAAEHVQGLVRPDITAETEGP